jgi:hypothetical protein
MAVQQELGILAKRGSRSNSRDRSYSFAARKNLTIGRASGTASTATRRAIRQILDIGVTAPVDKRHDCDRANGGFVTTEFRADSKQTVLRSQPHAPQQVCVTWVVPKGI